MFQSRGVSIWDHEMPIRFGGIPLWHRMTVIRLTNGGVHETNCRTFARLLGRPARTLALQKLHRICQAEVRRLKARYSLAAVKLALSRYRSALRAVEAGYLALDR